jgi:hypothetical protein
MSCCCNTTPCSCSSIAPVACCTPTTESVEYTFENQGLIGIGVFDNDTDNLVGFRSIASDTLALTVTLDATNKAIIISFNDDLLIDDIPTFTETIRGIGEAATQAETNAGVADDKIVTPLKLQNRTATETQAGILEIATQAEVTTGTNDTNAVTPLKLATFAGTQFTTRTFTDAVARGAATPSFLGQFGGQQDTDSAWIGSSLVAGGWTQILVSGLDFLISDGSFDPTWMINSGSLTFDGNGNSATLFFDQFDIVSFSDCGLVNFTGTTGVGFYANVDFTVNARILDNGVLVPANSVLSTSGTAGQLSSALISTFLSSANQNTGWTAFSNSATRKTGDCNTITLPELAQVVDTLIQTLGTNRLLPIP